MMNPVDDPEAKPQYLVLQSSKRRCHFGRLSLGITMGVLASALRAKLLQANGIKTVFIGKSSSSQGQGCFCGDLPWLSKNTSTV